VAAALARRPHPDPPDDPAALHPRRRARPDPPPRPLPALRPRRAAAEIAQTTNAKGLPQAPSALNHLRTLRAALNLAVREQLIGSNPARHIEIVGYRRPHAQIWTDGRVEAWERTGGVCDRGHHHPHTVQPTKQIFTTTELVPLLRPAWSAAQPFPYATSPCFPQFADARPGDAQDKGRIADPRD
jgi:hypothetical protein